MNISTYLGDKPFWKTAARLAIPIALQNMLTSSFHLVDTMMVSRLGDLTLSAVGMAGQWGWMSLLLSFGLCSGSSIFIAQYWGVQDHRGIRRVLGIALLSCLLLSGVFLLVALLAPTRVLHMFNRDPAVVEVGCRYLVIACLSYPAVALTNVLVSVLRSTEQVRLPMYVSAITVVTNAVCNYGLIFGKLGMPHLGVEGAAVATCISSWLGPVLILAFSLPKRNLLIGPVRELFSFSSQDLALFYRRAMPVVLNEGLWSLGIVLLNTIYSNMGYEYYAGMTIYKTFTDLSMAFYLGLGGACVVMVGKSVGMGKIRRGILDSTRFAILVPLASALIGTTLILLRHPLVSIFSNGVNLSRVTVQTALYVTVFCCAESFLRNISYIFVVGVFRSGGDSVTGMVCDIASLWLVGIPLAYAAANWFQWSFLAVVAAAYLGEDIPKAILCLVRFRSKKWLKPVTPEGIEGLRTYLFQNKQAEGLRRPSCLSYKKKADRNLHEKDKE